MAFEEYKEVPETAPLEFLEDSITWVASKISSAVRALGAEAIEPRIGSFALDVHRRSLELSLPICRT